MSWFKIEGQKVFYANYRGLDGEQMIERLDEIIQIYRLEPEKFYSLIDFTNSFLSEEYISEMMNGEITALRKQKIIKTAVIGLNFAKVAILEVYKVLNGDEKFKLFDTKEEALEWLTSEIKKRTS
ncbi:hypothetical protein [Leptospira perdikensis]|uniref:STAS/SEC14 domain-containing protein n=1 Tax=Leptospira perdikensis TaxID=2484948 RepID=A0A4R9JI70_9LEPT|nr:hypothetical protein [Leptospira perdikensis]TGL44350.1 hypothetical protein EHQ49_02415 [Leptospira perdikensis]